MQVAFKQRQEHLTIDVQRDSGGFRARFGEREHHVEVVAIEPGALILIVDGERHRVDIVHRGRERLVAIGGETYRFESESGTAAGHEVGNVAAPEIVAPMPGKVTQVLVQLGDKVAAGDGLVILEAMKMENRLLAEAAAVVSEVRVTAGQMVDGGQVLVVLRYGEEG